MLNWHWVYRDFVFASLKSRNSEERLEEISRSYFSAHERLLNEIHFTPKGYPTKSTVKERINQLGHRRYNKLLNAIGSDFERLENRLQSTANSLLEKLQYTGIDQDVYVIVGLDCTNIYSTKLNGSPITVLCLEATEGDDGVLELLLSHECHHWRRQQQVNHDIFTSSIGERMVSEGLASYFSKEIQPGLSIPDYCYVSLSTVEWAKNNQDVLNTLYDDLDSSYLMSTLFSRTPNEQIIHGMPPRTGYVFGYLKVKEFLTASQQSASEMSGVPWETVMSVR